MCATIFYLGPFWMLLGTAEGRRTAGSVMTDELDKDSCVIYKPLLDGAVAYPEFLKKWADEVGCVSSPRIIKYFFVLK